MIKASIAGSISAHKIQHALFLSLKWTPFQLDTEKQKTVEAITNSGFLFNSKESYDFPLF
jgi:hypothetical protein